MSVQERRPWLPGVVATRIEAILGETAGVDSDAIEARLLGLVARNREIHERDGFNLNPATNVMNPRAEALLASGLRSRPSLGNPGDKYETGLEEIEVIAAGLAAEIFHARHAEIRVDSGALANLYALMATTRLGDPIIAPPATVGGHVTTTRRAAPASSGPRASA